MVSSASTYFILFLKSSVNVGTDILQGSNRSNKKIKKVKNSSLKQMIPVSYTIIIEVDTLITTTISLKKENYYGDFIHIRHSSIQMIIDSHN
jgi:hypothetical protein